MSLSLIIDGAMPFFAAFDVLIILALIVFANKASVETRTEEADAKAELRKLQIEKLKRELSKGGK